MIRSSCSSSNSGGGGDGGGGSSNSSSGPGNPATSAGPDRKLAPCCAGDGILSSPRKEQYYPILSLLLFPILSCAVGLKWERMLSSPRKAGVAIWDKLEIMLTGINISHMANFQTENL